MNDLLASRIWRFTSRDTECPEIGISARPPRSPPVRPYVRPGRTPFWVGRTPGARAASVSLVGRRCVCFSSSCKETFGQTIHHSFTLCMPLPPDLYRSDWFCEYCHTRLWPKVYTSKKRPRELGRFFVTVRHSECSSL